MGKLRMKRTPEEQAAHDIRKAHRAARKHAKRSTRHSDRSHSPKRRRTEQPEDEDDSPHSGPSHAYKPDYDEIRARVEEERFREKLWGAFDDDERLDSVEASLNSFAHVPRRWRSGGMDRMEDDLDIHPQSMEEEDYAEWVRMGMWRKKHAAEHAEQLRKEQERAARRAREEAARAETKKLEKQAEEDRRKRRKEKEHKRWADARERYEMRWKELLGPVISEGPARPLKFMDVPWPILFSDDVVDELEAITPEAISTFLLPTELFFGGTNDPTVKKARRERLREALLRFHPDKFEGRILSRVEGGDKEKTREAVAKIAVALNTLMSNGE
ncbi:hypothetical protein BXZ70DRAFT_999075 [Cristinia sonorae]|uniref:Uncharacterized protein n=1 Tax=Cristinia sonorae TaxID=1940300 RepID=A0A8K0XSA7_9AGAR|nr:hypothetical protein BXZ70DRAFT_999075 [Cristinia sonorae]